MYRRAILILVLVLLVFSMAQAKPVSKAAGHWQEKPEFRIQQLYRGDERNKGQDLYITRVSAAFDYLGAEDKILLRIEPFCEIKNNIRYSFWERKEVGAEFGRDIFPWFYLGEAIQAVWMREDYQVYEKHERRHCVESETRFLFSHSLISTRRIKLKGYILDEYTYDFNKARGVYNQISVGLITPIGKNIEAAINWRHIDRIHHYDSDTVETSLTLVF